MIASRRLADGSCVVPRQMPKKYRKILAELVELAYMPLERYPLIVMQGIGWHLTGLSDRLC